MSQPSRAARLTWSKSLRYAVSLGLIAAFVRLTDWSQLSTLRGHIQPLAMVGAVLCAGLAYALHGPRWALLLRAQGAPVTQAFAQRVTWIGTFYNAFLIGGAGGDAARVYYVCQITPRDQWPQAIAATAIDRLLGLVVLLGLGGALAGIAAAPASAQPVWAAAALALLSALVVVALQRKDLPAPPAPASPPSPSAQPVTGARSRLARLRRQARETWTRVRVSPRSHVVAIALSLVIWLLDFVSIWLVAQSIGLPLGFLPTCLAACASYAAAVLPISVGGHGVREGSLILTLQAFGALEADDSRALLLALGAWAVTMLWSLVGGLALLSRAETAPR